VKSAAGREAAAVTLIALGNADAGDDGAALQAARAAAATLPGCALVEAGRPGVDLLDLLESARRVVIVDVVRSNAPPGTLHAMPLDALLTRADARPQPSSHGVGPAEALRLADALGRPLPRGTFVGIEGRAFSPGAPLSPEVRGGMTELVEAVREAAHALLAEAAAAPAEEGR
jgi:hydrogenase maturation protease